ncbi:MAG TPA: hypothetical protein VFS15_13235 [Kofleriaceae bacterium]|nr:hypothetical protein [Kofleriaceae bacterium]
MAMRALGMCIASLLACSSVTSEPAPDTGSGSDDGRAAACQDARDCGPDDEGCASYPYESLPARCVDICYRGRCCEQTDGAWHLVIYDCARPSYDAGIDAP